MLTITLEEFIDPDVLQTLKTSLKKDLKKHTLDGSCALFSKT